MLFLRYVPAEAVLWTVLAYSLRIPPYRHSHPMHQLLILVASVGAESIDWMVSFVPWW